MEVLEKEGRREKWKRSELRWRKKEEKKEREERVISEERER